MFEPGAELFDGETAVSSKVDQSFFLPFELLQLFTKRILLFLVRRLELDENPSHFNAHRRDVLGVEAFGRDCPTHLLFEFVEAN